MKQKTSRSRFTALIALVALPFLAGCGGADDEGDLDTPPFLPAALTVNWPGRSTKALDPPSTANSVVLSITPIDQPKGTIEKAGTFDRFPGKNEAYSRTYKTTLDVVRVGGISTVVVDFYSSRSGVGTLLASGTARVTFDKTGNIGDVKLQGCSVLLKGTDGKTIEMEPTE